MLLSVLGWMFGAYACSGFLAAALMTRQEASCWKGSDGLSPASICGVYLFSVVWVYASMLITLVSIPGMLVQRDLSVSSEILLAPFAFVWHALVCPIEIVGECNVPLNTPVVFVANHQSMVDCMIPRLLGGRVRTVLKRQFLFIPGIGSWMWMCGHIFVDTKASVLKNCGKAIQSKDSVFMFPQGTRGNRNAETRLPFRNGAFEVALDNQCPVVCLSINVPRSTWNLATRREPVRVTIHEPIDPGSHTLESLRARCFERVYSVRTR